MEQVGEILLGIVKYGGALFAIFGVIFAVWHWVQKQNTQSDGGRKSSSRDTCRA